MWIIADFVIFMIFSKSTSILGWHQCEGWMGLVLATAIQVTQIAECRIAMTSPHVPTIGQYCTTSPIQTCTDSGSNIIRSPLGCFLGYLVSNNLIFEISIPQDTHCDDLFDFPNQVTKL